MCVCVNDQRPILQASNCQNKKSITLAGYSLVKKKNKKKTIWCEGRVLCVFVSVLKKLIN